MPVFLTLVLVVVQVALAWHAKTIVDAAASDALVATQVEGGSEAAGRDAANDLLEPSSSQLLRQFQISIDRTADVTTVQVQAKVTNVVPLLPVTVRSTASGPNERFRSDRDTP